VNSVQGILTSRRVNRWLPWVAGLVLAAGVIAFLAVYFSNTAESTSTPLEKAPAYVPKQEKSVPISRAQRELAGKFILAAVMRKDPVQAYKLSGPEIRQGETLKEWIRDWKNPNVGVPIVPYTVPLDKAPMRVDTSTKNEAVLEVILIPKNADASQTTQFWLGMNAFGKGKNRHWLVNYWAPSTRPSVPIDQGK
jgi:hypothetical protein